MKTNNAGNCKYALVQDIKAQVQALWVSNNPARKIFTSCSILLALKNDADFKCLLGEINASHKLLMEQMKTLSKLIEELNHHAE
jgi:hypothetical protein